MATRAGVRIIKDPKIRFGKPVIEGTRVDVQTIVAALAEGWTADEVAAEYQVSKEAVLAALSYAAASLENDRAPTK